VRHHFNKNYTEQHTYSTEVASSASCTTALSASKDGNLVFVASTDDTIEMIDIRQKDKPDKEKDVRKFFRNGHVGLVKSMQLSNDETVLFTGGMDGSMLIWDVRKLQVMAGFGNEPQRDN
jgi:WD40 repeat protein